MRKKQPEQALAEAERALALDPNYADSYQVLAHVLNFVGRPEEAIGLAEKALRLDPRGPCTRALLELSSAYRSTGRVEEAIATIQASPHARPQLSICLHEPGFQLRVCVGLAVESGPPDAGAGV